MIIKDMQREWKVGDKILHKKGTHFGLLLDYDSRREAFSCIIFKVDHIFKCEILTPEKKYQAGLIYKDALNETYVLDTPTNRSILCIRPTVLKRGILWIKKILTR